MGNEDVLRYLANKGANLDLVNDRYKCTALQCAAEEGKKHMVYLLLELGANINGPPGNKGFVIHYALKSRDEFLVKHLLQEGAVIDDSKHSTIINAISARLPGLIPLLLENGADINGTADDISPPAWAFYKWNNQKEAFRLLMDRGASLRDSDVDVLIRAIEAGSLEDVKELLDHGMNPNCCDEYQTPLKVRRYFLLIGFKT